MERVRPIWKIIGCISFVAAVTGLAGVVNYSAHYGNNNPTIADPSSGRIHVHNHHGKVVYLNDSELMRIRLAHGALIVGGLGFMVAGSFGGLFRSNR